MKLFIRNMVCSRCKMVVGDELTKLGLNPLSIELGEVSIKEDLNASQLESVNVALQRVGFSLIDNKRSQLIERIKKLMIELVQENNSSLKTNLSNYISETLDHDYHYLSNLFSEVEGTTIEKYFIAQKIEKVKELLVYDELTLSQIANQLQYSSVAHLSNQFKKVTGLSPSHFKTIREEKRKSLDEV